MSINTGQSKQYSEYIPKRFEKDCEKYNEASLYGWIVIRVTPIMIRDGRALDWLERALLD